MTVCLYIICAFLAILFILGMLMQLGLFGGVILIGFTVVGLIGLYWYILRRPRLLLITLIITLFLALVATLLSHQ